jgi:hypothetical protein
MAIVLASMYTVDNTVLMTKRSYKAWVVRTNPTWVFVPYPETKGLYVRTDVCVIHARCPQCHSAPGVPCVDSNEKYTVQTHYGRRQVNDAFVLTERDGIKVGSAVEIDLTKVARAGGK